MPIGYNKAKEPWEESRNNCYSTTNQPEWVDEYYEKYPCIERLIIAVSHHNYKKSENSN
jgi:hypothetical protein